MKVSRRFFSSGLFRSHRVSCWDKLAADHEVHMESGQRKDFSRETFLHSSAHLLGDALEQHYGDDILLRDGPPLMDHKSSGFFYEMSVVDDSRCKVSSDHFGAIESLVKAIVNRKHKFSWMDVSVHHAQEAFQHNPYKLGVLQSIAEAGDTAATARLYRCGDFVDLCTGPHIPTSALVRYFRLTGLGAVDRSSSSSEGSGGQQQTPYIRVYGMSFPKAHEGQRWEKLQQEAKQRDHRVVGARQKLTMFHASSPGSAFFLPNGTVIYTQLVDYMRSMYKKHGYQEVMTPLLYDEDLWRTSGHLKNYKDDMFFVEGQRRQGLKPMNCPSHCLIFGHERRTRHDLPLRLADFGVLHRNEAEGALTGLTRVRKFQQDDAHIFCSTDQLESELRGVLDMIDEVYQRFGFRYSLRLGTRPAAEKSMGSDELWENAETALRAVLGERTATYEVEEGGGAFYGPKIDVVLEDALGRKHQMGTVQLDWNLPERFKLKYDDTEMPVMIHRAVFGSVERMIAILMEHFGGRWPFWLNPKQVAVLPVNSSEQHADYAAGVIRSLEKDGVRVALMPDTDTLQKRVRKAQLEQFNYVIVVGDEEIQGNSVNVRTREGGKTESMQLTQFKNLIEDLK